MTAALDLFAERGFSTTTTQDIADRAGVTKGAFYYHFKSKDEALRIIHDEFIDRALAAQVQALERFETPTEQLARMAYDTTLVCIEFQKHVKVFFREQHILSGDVRDAILAKRQLATRWYQHAVRSGIERGEFSQEVDPDVAALGLLGMWVWTYQWYRPDGDMTPAEIARQLTVMSMQSIGAKVPPDVLT